MFFLDTKIIFTLSLPGIYVQWYSKAHFSSASVCDELIAGWKISTGVVFGLMPFNLLGKRIRLLQYM